LDTPTITACVQKTVTEVYHTTLYCPWKPKLNLDSFADGFVQVYQPSPSILGAEPGQDPEGDNIQ